jgi:2-methylcitrate dehydratase PrpD
MNITYDLAEFITRVKFDSLPRDVIKRAKHSILDWLGAALAGSQELPSMIIRRVVEKLGGNPESSVIGTSLKTSCINAALVNGVSGHVLELDDIHEEAIIHPAATVLPSALAVGEREDVDGKELITAIVIGYEVEIRIGIAVNPSHYNYWHTTGTIGTFGAVVAAGKILNLDQRDMIHAFGIAGTMASGLIEVFGSMSKPLNVGKAAMNGVLAALLAKEGFTSSTKIFESERGYLRATSKELDLEKITKDLGKTFEIINNIFKIHASCGHTHAAIDAVLEIVKKYDVKPEDISEILVGTYPIAVDVVGKNYEPMTPYEAKFSLPYCVAVALIHKRVGLKEFSNERLNDPEIRALAKKVKIFIEPECMNVRLGCAKVIIHTKNGREYSAYIDAPKGYPQNPLTTQELEEKFKSLAFLVLPEDRVMKVLEIINVLENVSNVGELMALLRK